MPKKHLFFLLLALFFIQLGANYLVVASLNRQEVLAGEEGSLAFRDPAMLPQRLQHNPFATTFGAQVFYWAGSHLTPGFDLFYGRWWKATFMALLPPLLFLYGRRRLGLSVLGAATAAVLAGLLPAWLSQAWFCTVGLDIVVGLGGLLLLSTRRAPLVVASGFLMACMVMLYEAGFAFFPLYFIELFLYWRTSPDRRRAAMTAGGALALLAFTMSAPFLWWTNSPRVYLGGGEFVSSLGKLFARNGAVMLGDLFVGSRSYYTETGSPALSNPWLMAAAGVGLALSLLRWRRWWPIYLIMGAAVGIMMIAGGVTGLRRAFFLLPGAMLLVGGLVDDAKTVAARKLSPRTALAAMALLIASLVAVPAVQGWALTRDYASGKIAIPRDFPLNPMPGMNQIRTIEYVADHPETAAAVFRASPGLDPTLFLGILYVYADRTGRATAPPFLDQMLLVWRANEALYKSFGPSTRF